MDELEAIRKMLKEDGPMARALKEGVKSGVIKSGEDMGLEPGEKAVILVGPNSTINGSKQVRCSCGRIAWVAPSTQQLMKKKGPENFMFLCATCLPEYAQAMEAEAKRTQ